MEKIIEDSFRIAILGNDARVVAMINALQVEGVEIMVIGDKINPQIAHLAQCKIAKDLLQTAQLIEDWGAELVLVGPEKYLLPIDDGAAGSIVDILERKGISVAAPGYLPSLIELDKAWMIKLAIKYEMTGFLPESGIFHDIASIDAIQKAIDGLGAVAVKPAGLTGGKGVRVFSASLKDKKAALDYAKEILHKRQKVIIQRRISGIEFSLHGFVYKCGFVVFAPLVADYKLLHDNDTGIESNPNTGGMGSISHTNGLLPGVSNSVCFQAKKIIKRIISAIEEETGECYKGPIYGQFMLGEDGKLYLIEINARLGNSEALNILPFLAEGEFLRICRDMVSSDHSCHEIFFRRKATAVKYVVPMGYPGSSRPVEIKINNAGDLPVKLFFGGIIEDGEGNLITDGSRAIAVRAEADTVSTAAKIVNDAILKIFENNINELHWRPGIGINGK